MTDPIESDIGAILERLGAQYGDGPAYIDALLERFASQQASEARSDGPLADEILRASRKIGYERGEAEGLLAVGFVHFLWQRNREALPLILEAKYRLEGFDAPVSQARCLTILAGLNNTMGSYQKALELAHEALSRLEEVEESEWNGWPNYMLGDAYRATGSLDRAHEHYERAFAIFSSREVAAGTARALIGLGSTSREQGDLEASEDHFSKALDLARRRGDPFTMGRSLSELALIHQLRHHFDDALELFAESLEIRRGQGGGLFAATCLIDLGKLLVSIDRVDEGLERLVEALEISREHDHKPRIFAAHEALSTAYAKKYDLDKALHHHKEFQRIKEEVMSADTDTRLQNLEVGLEAAAAQKEAELVMQHNEELRTKNADLARLLEELRETQEMLIQSEKMASLGQLTAGIAHEIRNPLNFVNNFSAMTRDLVQELNDELVDHRDDLVRTIESEISELASEITANLDRILEHGGRAGQIVNGMLVHSRQSRGKKTEVDANALVSTCIDLAYHGFLATDDEFEVAIERHLGAEVGRISVMEDEMVRVLTNILHNAFYAVREHAKNADDDYLPTIRVQTRRSDGSVKVTIADNGPGIDDGLKKKVFEPFFTTKPTGSGTGLGLSQSYEIIAERHGGTLDVVDTQGGGATFILGLPALHR